MTSLAAADSDFQIFRIFSYSNWTLKILIGIHKIVRSTVKSLVFRHFFSEKLRILLWRHQSLRHLIRVKRCVTEQRTVVPELLSIGQWTKFKAKKNRGRVRLTPPPPVMPSRVGYSTSLFIIPFPPQWILSSYLLSLIVTNITLFV